MLIPRNITIDVFHHCDPGGVVAAKLDAIQQALERLPPTLISELEPAMSVALDNLTREVAETKTAAQSAVTLIGGLADQIRDLKDDPAALEALAASLDEDQAAIAAAVTANTPAEEPPPAEPPVGEDTQGQDTTGG